MLSNHDLADEALNAAFTMCDGDPLLYNELGVMAFNRGKSVTIFNLLYYEALLLKTCANVGMIRPRHCLREHLSLRRSPKARKLPGQRHT